jgi:hypothetical protein
MANGAPSYVLAWVFPLMLLMWDAVQLARAGNANAEGTASIDWPTVDGTITASQVVENATGSRASRYEFTPAISYSYVVDGHPYVGTRVRFLAFDPHGRGEAQAIVARYPVNAKVTVHYDAASPSDAVLEPGAPPRRWQRKVIGVACVAVGLGTVSTLLVALTRRRRRRA